MKSHAYAAYGLTIESEFAFPELPSGATDERVVVVKKGRVPSVLNGAAESGPGFQAGEGELLLEVPGVARYFVEAGEVITVEPFAGATDDDVRLFLLGSVLGAILMQRGRLVLHGSVVCRAGQAVAFLGDSGVGKSTLAASLVADGMTLVSDDICSVADLQVDPGFPQSKLWLDSLDWMGRRAERYRRIRPGFEKRAVPLAAEEFCSRRVPLGDVYVLGKSVGAELSARELSGAEKLLALSEKTYRPQFLKGLGLSRSHFRQLAELAKAVRVVEICRPEGEKVDDRLTRAVVEDLEARSRCSA